MQKEILVAILQASDTDNAVSVDPSTADTVTSSSNSSLWATELHQIHLEIIEETAVLRQESIKNPVKAQALRRLTTSLADTGLSSLSSHIPPSQSDIKSLFTSARALDTSDRDAIASCCSNLADLGAAEAYFYRAVHAVTSLRPAVPAAPAEVPSKDLQRLMGFCESLLLIACEQRAAVADAAKSVCSLRGMSVLLNDGTHSEPAAPVLEVVCRAWRCCRETFAALDCFIKNAQGSEGCDAAIDSISKPISAINACASSALTHIEQSSWMQRTFGSLSRTFVTSLQDAIGRCCDLISHLIAAVESHVSTPNEFFETNTVLPFIRDQCCSTLTLLQKASAACTPPSSGASFGATPHPIDFSHIVAHCAASAKLPENANLIQEHSSQIEFCNELSQSVEKIKGHFSLPTPPNSLSSQEVSRAASSSQAVIAQVVELNRNVCKVGPIAALCMPHHRRSCNSPADAAHTC
jgi:hypothetical protein